MRLLLVALVLLTGCSSQETPAPTGLTPRPLAHATGFRMLGGPGYDVAEVTAAWPGMADTLRYALVPRSAPDSVRASLPDGLTVIDTPVQSLAALSTTFLALLDRAGASDAVTSVSGGDWVNTPSVRAGIAEGRIADFGTGEQVDPETLLAAEPDAVLMSVVSGPGETARALESAGVPVVYIGDWVETTPLGRMEWIVLMGALVGREAQARAYADSVADRYERLRLRQAGRTIKTPIISGSAWQGTWHVPGGGSYLAAFIRDAGGTYPWIDTDQSGSVALDLETVVAEASDARVWIAPGAVGSLRQIRRADDRYLNFHAVQTGRVFNYDARISPGGGMDFFETAVAEPDVVLADLIQALHTGSLPEHEMTYFRRLPPRNGDQ
jgi:iron complex transport system substrate-binding protein